MYEIGMTSIFPYTKCKELYDERFQSMEVNPGKTYDQLNSLRRIGVLPRLITTCNLLFYISNC